MAEVPEARRPTLLYRSRGTLVVLVHTDAAPDIDEWNAYLGFLEKAMQHPSCTILVVGKGPGPNARQRDALAKITPKRVRTVVLSDSPIVRGIVTLLSWFHENISSQSPFHIEKAFDYLGVPTAERPAVSELIASMKMELTGHPPAPESEGISHAVGMLRETAIAPMDAAVARLDSLRNKLGARRRS